MLLARIQNNFHLHITLSRVIYILFAFYHASVATFYLKKPFFYVASYKAVEIMINVKYQVCFRCINVSIQSKELIDNL